MNAVSDVFMDQNSKLYYVFMLDSEQIDWWLDKTASSDWFVNVFCGCHKNCVKFLNI